MPVSPGVQAVFGHFQNLNLLALLHDLRDGRTARRAWLSGSLLCPIAHGVPAGAQVRDLRALGQTADLSGGCQLAARLLGADPGAVLRFVRSWDDGAVSPGWLLRQLEEVWQERLADAQALQGLLEGGPSTPEGGGQEGGQGARRDQRPPLGNRPGKVGGRPCVCEAGRGELAQ
jgi:hypothetical protein